MQILCDYCKNWIEDTAEKCPYCGASNANLKRMADATPKTIAELKTWYEERNLPPEETTRFFIGKDYRKPKAFGIYQDGSKFIVYKNKADGSRAVRYKGPDEAYAVNELYLKLKEEILHQKARNIAARSGGTQNVSRGPGDIYKGEPARAYEWPSAPSPEDLIERDKKLAEEAAREERRRIAREEAAERQRQERLKRRKRTRIWLAAIGGAFLSLIGACSVNLYNKRVRGDWYAVSADPVYYRYEIRKDDTNVWEWWRYTGGEWISFGETDKTDLLPNGITKDDHYTKEEKVEKKFGVDIPPLRKSRAFLDMHPEKPRNSYYYADNRLWYYATDQYGSRYGVDRNGWYYYDEDDTSWHFLSRYYDYDQVPEELYYTSDDYRLTDNYSKLKTDYAYVFPADFVWGESGDFKNSSYYSDIEWSQKHYQEEQREKDKNNDDNDSWDWDDNDNWDSNDYDWDSDW
ncbi:MAG: hypothetical protein IKR59_08635 [Lachnospiraceae bacterium]|nr:hypothetical protein [Lachnospiraceae bacterium]